MSGSRLLRGSNQNLDKQIVRTTLSPHPGPLPQSVFEKWVARAARPFRSATRRPERARLSPAEGCPCSLPMRSPFRPASRRTAQASGLCYPKRNFQTRSQGEGERWRRLGRSRLPPHNGRLGAKPVAELRTSLSLREKAGVRGNSASISTHVQKQQYARR